MNPMTKPKLETYLGDGVYATFDGEWFIRLDLRAQDSTTVIALEPPVLRALLEFVKQAWPKGVPE
jgi:hypothetical protein